MEWAARCALTGVRGHRARKHPGGCSRRCHVSLTHPSVLAEELALAALRDLAAPKPSAASNGDPIQFTMMRPSALCTAVPLPAWATRRVLCELLPVDAAIADVINADLPVPLTLLEPLFGAFVDDTVRAVATPAEGAVYAYAATIMERMRQVWPSEVPRNDMLLAPLGGALGVRSLPRVSIARYDSDGTLTVNGAVVLHLEMKQRGKGGWPELQNDAYYVKTTLNGVDGAGIRADAVARSPRLPAFLLDVIDGTVLVVRGATICSPCLLTEVLATVNLAGYRDGAIHLALTRVLLGLRRGVAALTLRHAETNMRLRPMRGPQPCGSLQLSYGVAELLPELRVAAWPQPSPHVLVVTAVAELLATPRA